MCRPLLPCLGACLLLTVLPGPARAADAEADELALKQAGIPTDGPGLLDFFRRRTADVDEARLKALARQLGDDSFQAREDASRQLVAVGARARELLRAATRDADVEVVRRAEECLRQIDRGVAAGVVASAVRALARRRPDGAAAALLAYLPSAEDDEVAEEVRSALGALALRDGKPEPALAAALKDELPARRAAAGAALARAGRPELLASVRPLLRDGDPEVRLRVGLALAVARDREAIPVLIALLGELPRDRTWRVEDALYLLAGDKAPEVPSGTDEASRRRCRDAWEGWWKGHGARADLARLGEALRPLGCTLVVVLDLEGTKQGRVVDLDPSNRPRWQVEGLQFPLDVQLLPGDRVLVAEHGGGRVTERNRKGEVLWEKRLVEPLAAQRLPNGNTFIATRFQLLEVDKAGKEVFSYSRPGGEVIMRATRLPNGDLAMITQLGTTRYARVDRTGKELKGFGVDVRTSGGRIEVLPNGHVLVPEMGNNRVVEHDADGKVVWEAAVPQPIAAVRLPNGNTLVTSMSQNRAVELNRAGKEVWEYRADLRVTRALRR